MFVLNTSISLGVLSSLLFSFLFFSFIERGILCVALAVLALYSVDQARLELRDPTASTSQVLGLRPVLLYPALVFVNSMLRVIL